ncbi:hypothetical protein [Bradyrhizobium ottawaense]|uniref:hypothetical protein n=1 Tax=Bradyrhizobium ottawaense TaxID=931866 RepID=UPI0030F3827B
MRQLVRENTALRRLFYRLQLRRARAQSDESAIITRLSFDAPKTFIEFGFHPIQFNCIELARSPEWSGLLIDGSARQVDDARALYSERISIVNCFLTLDNLDFVRRHFREVGVLSIDIDGNDYWMLKSLIDVSPSVISVEYNASFGLEPVTVPYEPSFDRHQKHEKGWYHGASLTALGALCEEHGYHLAAISRYGANAFFTRTGTLEVAKSWVPNALRNKWSGSTAKEQWQAICHLPLIRV